MTLKTVRHKISPFREDMQITVGTKAVRITTLGKDDNILINQHSGDVTGTHVVARKKIDKTKFVKTFADYMSFTFDLTKAGNKALRVVMWAVKEFAIGKDTVFLDRHAYEDFLSAHEGLNPPLVLSYPTFGRGLAELEKAKIIAKTIRVGSYFINPDCLFNGDKIAFTTIIEKTSEGDTHKQMELENN